MVLAGGGTSQITPTATSIFVTQQPSDGVTGTVLLPPGATQNRADSTSTTPLTTTSSSNSSSPPLITSSPRKSTPIGAIVGGATGGIALIALISFLAWFCLRRRRQDKAFAAAAAQNQRLQTDAATAIAFQNLNQISEIGGTPKAAAAFIQPHSLHTGLYPGKPADGDQDVYGGTTNHFSPESPPSASRPSQWSPSIISPMSNYSAEEQRRLRGFSPISPLFGQTGQLSGQQGVNGTGGVNWGSLNVAPAVQEMSASTGGINRRPLVGGHGAGPGQYVDMSGAPMSPEFHLHELE